jgi:hypothetical protein
MTHDQILQLQGQPMAPTFYVSNVGGIYREESHLIRVTFIDDIRNSEGELVSTAQARLVWKTAQFWLNTRDVFDYAMDAFRRGAIGNEFTSWRSRRGGNVKMPPNDRGRRTLEERQ